MNDDDHFLMSLIDTLACGLGACLLLFTVFIILINVDDKPNPEQGRAKRAVADNASVATGIKQGRIKPSLMVRVRGACPFIETVTGKTYDFEKSLFLDARNGKKNEKCVAVLLYQNPPIGSDIELHSVMAPDETISLTATWGGTVLDNPDGYSRELKVSGNEDEYAFATVRLDGGGGHIVWAE